MLKLYYSPGLCSLVSHIVLEETGAAYTTEAIHVPKGEHKSAAYLAVNPRGQVPALCVDQRVITETVAILVYLAQRFPAARLLPDEASDATRCLSTLAWFASTVHPSFTPIVRPDRYTPDGPTQAVVKDTSKARYWANCREIDGLLAGKQWMMGEQYTVCDAYALLFYGWGVRAALPMVELAAFTDFKHRMLDRRAVSTVVRHEEIPFL